MRPAPALPALLQGNLAVLTRHLSTRRGNCDRLLLMMDRREESAIDGGRGLGDGRGQQLEVKREGDARSVIPLRS